MHPHRINDPHQHLHLLPPNPRAHSPLALWHLLSLDAPSVAALWTYFIAQTTGVALPWTSPAAMFVAVWMIYAADRLLDARQLDTPGTHTSIEERHRFHHRFRSRFLTCIAIGSIVLVLLLAHVDHRALELYALLAALLGVWLLLIHARPQLPGTYRLPKELAVGIFFPAAIFIPTVARAPQLQLQLLPAAAFFAAVCSLNCLFLYAWEHPPQRTMPSHAHWTTLWSISHLTHISLALIVLEAFVAATYRFATLPALACLLSTALLLLLNMQRKHIASIHLRAAADLVLLTPLLFLWHR